MSKIKNIYAREILDSRGNPTIEVDLTLESGIMGRAAVPSGASTGTREALELRDGDNARFMGKGVLKAVNNVNSKIKELLIGQDCLDQTNIDRLMLEMDGTKNKEVLGANAILAVSMANLKAAAQYLKLPLHRYVNKFYNVGVMTQPKPMMNILNGGVHADNSVDFQEYMIIPNADTISKRVRIGTEIFHTLKAVLKEKGYATSVGDEGGFAPNLKSNKEGFDLIIEAIKKAGYTPGIDVNLGMDVAASEFYKDGMYHLVGENKSMTTEELVNYFVELVELYPIVTIEDPVDEEDWDGFKLFTDKLKDKIQIVGDDLFVTNKEYLQKGIDLNCGNSILIKVNQIGSITETVETINLAKQNNYSTVISHRSGETEDTTIASLSVGLNLGQIKTGSLSRTDRVCKYNELMRIDEDLKNM